MSRISDFFNTTLDPRKYMLTGNVLGLQITNLSDYDNSIWKVGISPGTCLDSNGRAQLELKADQELTIDPVDPETVYNLFLTDAGDIQYDTDVNGSNIISGGVTSLRWIGFVSTDANSVIRDFIHNDDMIMLADYRQAIIADATSTTYAPIDHSVALPVERVSKILYGAWAPSASANQQVRASINGTSLMMYIAHAEDANPPVSHREWGNSAYAMAAWMPFQTDMQFRTDGGPAHILLHGVIIKR